MKILNDDSLMPFGTHKGKKLEDVPAAYLLWLLDNVDTIPKNLINYINENKEVLQKEKADKGNHINRTIRGW